MKGLILKDFVNLKKNAKIMAVLAVFYGIMALTMKDTGFFSAIFTMLFAILTLSLYSYDDMAKWDAFALTMPVSKENIVQGKYIMMLLLTFIGFAFSLLFSVFTHLSVKSESLMSDIQNCGIAAAVVIFFYSITIPIITKMGVEKARLIFFMVYFIPFLLATMLKKIANEGQFTIPKGVLGILNTAAEYAYVIIPLVLAAALLISYKISVRIYQKKEF
jgi:hypothetical protein